MFRSLHVVFDFLHDRQAEGGSIALVKLIVRPISDKETVTELVGNTIDIVTLPTLVVDNGKGLEDLQSKYLQHYRSKAADSKANVHIDFDLADPVPSLKMSAVDPDNLIRVIYQKTCVLNPPFSIRFRECRECRRNNANGYFNPTFAIWQNRVIAAWGDPKTGQIQLAWFDGKGTAEIRPTIVSEQLLSLGPTEEGGKGYQGIGAGTAHPHLSKEVHGPSVVYLVDARLLALSTGDLHVTYTSVQLPQIVNIQYVTISPPKPPLTDSSVAVLTPPRQLGEGQKNWVTFEVQPGRVFHLQRINPMHVVEAKDITREDGTLGTEIVTIHKEEHKIPLPWHGRFGEELRGGTPAVSVRDGNGNKIFLAIFHTKAYCQHPYKMFTYFM